MQTYDIGSAETFAANALSGAGALAAVLDHTLLKAEATKQQVLQVCSEAVQYRFACVMVNPCWVSTAAAALAGTGVPVGVVIGFPLGASLSASKREEAARVIQLGAHDVDMVLNIGFLKSGLFEEVREEIASVAGTAHDAGAIVKVILETALLTFEEKLRASELAIAAGADFIKTSTGFSTGGATTEDIALMRGVAGVSCGVKASGGIRNLADTSAMLRAGATRIGASASVRIVQELGREPSISETVSSGSY